MSEAKRRTMRRRDFLKKAAGGAVLAAAGGALGGTAAAATPPDTSKVLNYNENMEYRRLGKTDLWVSAVCLGGHWKRLNAAAGRAIDMPAADVRQAFLKNRSEVVSKCIDVGINYVDACSSGEILAYAKVLQGRREQMYFGFSWYENELRFEGWRTKDKLIQCVDNGLRQAGLEYCDIWRVSAIMQQPQPDQDIEETIAAFEHLHKQGKVRFLGLSSHHRPFLKRLVETWPQFSVILFPYTANSKELPQDSLFDAVREQDVGTFGIKPFSSNSLFVGNSQDDSPTRDEDDERARLAIRYILGNDAITAPIPGLISIRQVDNMVQAIRERREEDITDTAWHAGYSAELRSATKPRGALRSTAQAKLDRAAKQMTARLPAEYRWLREWEWV